MFYILAVESPASRQHVSGAGDGWSMVNVTDPRQYPIMLVATNRSTSQSRRARTALVPRLFAEQRLSHLRRAGLLTSPCRAGWFPAAMMSAHSGSCTKHSLTPDQPRYAAARAGVRLAPACAGWSPVRLPPAVLGLGPAPGSTSSTSFARDDRVPGTRRRPDRSRPRISARRTDRCTRSRSNIAPCGICAPQSVGVSRAVARNRPVSRGTGDAGGAARAGVT